MTESKSKKRTTDDAKPLVIADLIGISAASIPRCSYTGEG
jgi:hypothetical protein